MKAALTALAFVLLAASCGGKSESESKRSGGSTSGKTEQNAATKTGIGTDTSTTTGPTLDFTADVSPVLKISCGGAICHGEGSSFGVYVDRKDEFLKAGPETLARLASADPALVMPRTGFGMELSDAGRSMIKSYLAQEGIQSGTAGGESEGDDPSGPAGTDTYTKPPSGEVTKLCADLSATDKAEGATLTFAAIKPVGTAACGGGGCHEGALPRGFVPVEAQWVDPGYGRGILTNLATGAMPIGGKVLSSADKRRIRIYICARKDL